MIHNLHFPNIKRAFSKSFLLLFFLLTSAFAWGQVDLARWNLTANGAVSYSDASVNATAIHYGSPADNPIAYSPQGMNTTTWSNSGIVHYRYFGISIASSNGSPVEIANLMFEHETFGQTNYTVRYYISPSGSLPGDDGWGFINTPGSTILVNNELIASNPVKNIPLNITLTGTQRLIIRFYAYGGQWSDIWRIKASTLKITGPSATPPVAENDNATTGQNIPVDIDVLDNDTYDTLDYIAIEDDPVNGDVIINPNNTVTYTPDNNYIGSDSFTYTITDIVGTSNEATVNVTVNPITAPTAVPDVVSLTQNQTIDINVLGNDSPGSGAYDYVTVVVSPTFGTVQVNPNNTITYTPNNNYSGVDSFQYNVTNVHNQTSNTTTVTLNISAVTDLVRWGNTNMTPTLAVSNLSASGLTNSSGSSGISGHEPDCGFVFRINEINAGTYNAGRYFQFSVTPDTGYNIDLSQYVFRYFRAATSPDNIRIRYSKQADFSSGVQELNATNLSLGENTVTLNFPGNTEVNSGETMYFRFHMYGIEDNEWWAQLCIRNTGSNSPHQGPTLRGKIRSNSTSNLSITKDVDEDEPDVDDEVKFTIDVTNNGPDNATGVTVTDILPTGYDFVSSTEGTYNAGTRTITWNIGNLATSDNASFDIFAKVLASGTYDNTASVTSNENDPDLSDNSDLVVVTPFIPSADLRITNMFISNPTESVGNNVIFTINVLNNGPDTASGVAVAALLPSGFQFVSSTQPPGTSYSGTTGVWTIGELVDQQGATINITAKVLATGNYTFNAEISGGVDDPDAGNNDGSAGITNAVDLAITKEADDTTPNIGGTVIFTITVENIGGTNATGVVVTDVIPSGYNYVTNSIGEPNATYDALTRTVTWNAGDLASAGTASFEIHTTARAGGNHNNIATVTANEGDSVPANNSDSASVIPDLGSAVDLKVVQIVDEEEPGIGDPVVFTITATNEGPNPATATGVSVWVLLANGLQIDNVTPSVGSYTPPVTPGGRGTWTIGNMANAATATLTVQATVLGDIGAAYVSIAEITGDQADYDDVITNNRGYAILSPVNQQFHPCDVNAEEPAFFDDFGSGASPYAPELEQGRTNMMYMSGVNLNDGQYTVAKNAQYGYDNWQDISDPSGDPDGYFMIVNADIDPYEFFRTRITLSEEFCTNTRYNINLKVINVNSQTNHDYCSGPPEEYPDGYIEPEIGYFVVNDKGEVLGAGTSGTIPYNEVAEWLDKQFVFVSGQDDEWIELVLFNKAPGGCGNDLAIDDITVYACMTPPIRLEMIIDTTEEEVCGGETVTMTVINTPDPEIENDNYEWPPEAWGGESGIVEYQWQRSDDGVNFTDIPGETTDTYIIENFQEEDQAYYRLMYAQDGNIEKVFCRFPSAQYYPVFNATPDIPPIRIENDGPSYICGGENIPDGTLQLYTDYDTSAYVDEEGNSTWGPDFYFWSSSDSAVATIDAETGLVTAVSTGVTTITYFVESPKGSCDNYVTKDISVMAECPSCVEDPVDMDTDGVPSVIGISTLAIQPEGWPENVFNGYIVLESKEKGFVITRLANTNAGTIPNPREGMLVYSIADQCIKLYNGSEWRCIEQECE